MAKSVASTPSPNSVWTPNQILTALPGLSPGSDVGKALCFVHCNGPLSIRAFLIFLCGLGKAARAHWLARYNFWAIIIVVDGMVDIHPYYKSHPVFINWVEKNCNCDCQGVLTASELAKVTYKAE